MIMAEISLEIDPTVKAIVSSGYLNDPEMSNYRQYDFSGFIPKPYSQGQMAEVLNKIMDNHESTKSILIV